jgi:hypothetical protein
LRYKNFCIASAAILLLTATVLIGAAQPAKLEQAQAGLSSNSSWKDVEQAMGRSGTLMPGDVFKFSMPRSDLNVKIENVTVNPALALGSWVAFKNEGNTSMLMGDLVLTLDEVNPVMQMLQQRGIEQTALHNHLLSESPRVMYMHISGRGDPVLMARVINDSLALTKTPINASISAQPMNNSNIDTDMLNETIGAKGKYNGGVYQFGIPRNETIMDVGMEVPPSMGVATGINFQPLGNGTAAIAGDFVLTGAEVNPVIKALRNNNINVTAIHNHMIYEEPRLFFLHFWSTGDQNKLASGLKEALNKTNSFQPG